MKTLPLVSFIGSAMLLFGVSNMLPNAGPAMNGPLRRLMMQAIVSLAVLGLSLFIVLTHRFDPRLGLRFYGNGCRLLVEIKVAHYRVSFPPVPAHLPPA
jgi:hypothetical protein